MVKFVSAASGVFLLCAVAVSGQVAAEPAEREVYFGETHLHKRVVREAGCRGGLAEARGAHHSIGGQRERG